MKSTYSKPTLTVKELRAQGNIADVCWALTNDQSPLYYDPDPAIPGYFIIKFVKATAACQATVTIYENYAGTPTPSQIEKVNAALGNNREAPAFTGLKNGVVYNPPGNPGSDEDPVVNL